MQPKDVSRHHDSSRGRRPHRRLRPFLARSLSEKEPVYQSIVAVSRVKGDNDSSLLLSLLSRRHAETTDERALQENVSALGTPALPA
jgi:hypothetical protein